MTDKELAIKLLKKFGIENQMKKLSEECAEFIQAQVKYELNNSVSNKGIQGIIDEIADIEIVISSIRVMLNSAINKAILHKTKKAWGYIYGQDQQQS